MVVRFTIQSTIPLRRPFFLLEILCTRTHSCLYPASLQRINFGTPPTRRLVAVRKSERSPHSNNQEKTSSETKAENSTPNKIEISSKIRAGKGGEKRNSKNAIDNDSLHSNSSNHSVHSSNSKDAHNKIETGRDKIDSNRLRSNNSSNEHSSNASKKIATGSCKIKTESNSARNNSEYKTTNYAGRNNSANGISTCVRVQVRNRETFGNSVGHAPGIPSTALGSNVVVIAATAYLTTGSAAP
jgi:hypothetical protein